MSSQKKTELLVAPCSHKAAKYAVEHWHYRGVMPAGKNVSYGVWEDSRFVGAIAFSRGSNKSIGKPFGLEQTEVCELTRVALTKHAIPTSRILMMCIRLLASSQNLRLIVSLADTKQNHLGILYQACNFIYIGKSSVDKRVQEYKHNGRVYTWRHVAQKIHDSGYRETLDTIKLLGYIGQGFFDKHKYLYPLDKAMRRQIAPLAQPYPKRNLASD